MAFVPWKDRVTSTPHRYKLTNVSGDTYDLTAVPGAIGEAGTPVNAANLNKLIQRDGDDIKDTVTTFTEASSRANIETGESTATLFGKIKKWFADLKPHAFTTPSATQSTSADTVPSSKLLKESSFARVYRSFTELDLDKTFTPEQLFEAMAGNSTAILDVTVENTGLSLPFPGYGLLIATRAYSAARCSAEFIAKVPNSTALYQYSGTYRTGDTSNKWSGWKQVINDADAQTITGIKTFATGATPLITDAPTTDLMAVNKEYVDGLSTPYSKVIRTQTEFEALIASPTWLGAESVALVGQFTYSEANNSGIKIPATVKQIHGFNSAKITITNFVYNLDTAKGGLWYRTRPTTLYYSIRDLEVDCTGTGTEPTNGYGFYNCTNLTNCTVTGTGTGATNSTGFYYCTNLTNCTGKGTGDKNGYGFYYCTNLTNCTGTGTGNANGYGFYGITYASNCRDGGSSTAMWGGINTNIDVDTCCMTPVPADNTELNT